MNKLFVFFNCFLLLSAVCWASGNKETDTKPTPQAQQQPDTSVPVKPMYWTGDGGKGKILSIRKPRATGLAANEETIPALVQGELHNNFSNYTAISTSTEESRNEQYAELLSGHYDDNSKAGWDLGHLPDPDYIIEGTITKTAIGFALQINVTKSADKSTAASYSETCTFDELLDLRAVRRASLYLMERMGVTPTELTRTELARPAVSNELAALNALAMRDTARTEFERMLYTYQANQLDPKLAEAARQLAAYQTEIYKTPELTIAIPNIKTPEIIVPEFKAPEIRMVATGNIGADARKQVEQYNAQKEASSLRQESGNRAVKDMQDAFLVQFRVQSETVKKQQTDLLGQRDRLLEQQKALLARQRQMIAQLRETENSYDTFFTEHPPFEIIYDPAAKPAGIANLEKGTIDMEFAITTVGTQAMEVIPLMLADFEKGLAAIAQGLKDINTELDKIESLLAYAEAEGNNALTRLVNDYAAQTAKVEAAENDYAAQLAKLDTELKTTGYAQLGRDYAVRTDALYAEGLARQYAVQFTGYNAATDKTLGDTWTLTKWNKDESRTFAIQARLENDSGKTIGVAAVNLTNQTFAKAYTQPLSDSASCLFLGVPVNDITDTLKVVIQQVNGKDVTVASNSGYIKISPLEANGYTKDGWNIAGYDKDGYDRYGYMKDGYTKAGYDRYGYDKDGYGKDGRNLNGLTRDQVKKNAQEVARRAQQARIDNMWGKKGHAGYFIGIDINLQPLGGLLEFGLEGGPKWFTVDAAISVSGGSLTGLKVDDKMLEKELNTIDWLPPYIWIFRAGAAVPLKFERTRLNIGGGIEWLLIGASGTDDSNKWITRNLGNFFTPYLGARLDFGLSKKWMPFIGYRCEFMPADKFETYFGESSSLRHSLFVGLEWYRNF